VKGSCRDVTWRGLVGTWRLICDWSYLLTFRWILTRLLLCGFVDINRHYTTQSRGRSRSRCRDLWVGCSWRPKLIALDFRKRTMEKIVILGGNHICFRKSLSQTFNLVRLHFFSRSPKFPFFFVIPTEPSIRTHRWCAEGSAEALGSKVLLQWTLNLRVYAHTCTQTKEIWNKTHIHKHATWIYVTHPG